MTNKIKHITLWGIWGLVILLCNGCDPITPTNSTSFDVANLYGHWVSGTLHEKYNQDGTGCTWDTADDVDEDEAQPFTWTLNKTTLVQYHQMEMGGVVPKTYTVTKLNATTFCYHDSYNTNYTFFKQE